jgi:hypothetical protein
LDEKFIVTSNDVTCGFSSNGRQNILRCHQSLFSLNSDLSTPYVLTFAFPEIVKVHAHKVFIRRAIKQIVVIIEAYK